MSRVLMVLGFDLEAEELPGTLDALKEAVDVEALPNFDGMLHVVKGALAETIGRVIEHDKDDTLRLVHRSAVTGQFVDGAYAEANPDTTVEEVVVDDH